MKAIVLGLGYVGLPLALRAAEVGHDVIGIDSALNKIQALEAKTSYIEDVPNERIANATNFRARLTQRGLRDTDEWDIAVIAVPTPLVAGTIEPDLRYIEEAARFLGLWMAKGRTVVLESTTYPGTTEEVVGRIIQEKSGLVPGVDFHLGFSPERIDPGNKVHTFENTPKLVSGIDDESLLVIQDFYASLVEHVVPVSNPRTAEMTKLVENSFAQINIAFVNELALVCSKLGLNVDEVLDAAATKGHTFLRFRPGPGVGGHCIPVDPMYLAHHMRERHDTEFRFAELAHEINDSMPGHVVSKASNLLGGVREKDVLVMGIAYKPNTADVRESPSMDVVKLFDELGAHVTVADDLTPNYSDRVPHLSSQEAVERAGEFDIVVIATDHDDVDYEGLYGSAQLILDTRNRYKGRNGKVRKL